jgi:hypothetical protein
MKVALLLTHECHVELSRRRDLRKILSFIIAAYRFRLDSKRGHRATQFIDVVRRDSFRIVGQR